MMEDLYDVVIARYDPGVQKGIPMNRVLLAKSMIERIRIGEHLRIEQVVEAEDAFSLAGSNRGPGTDGHNLHSRGCQETLNLFFAHRCQPGVNQVFDFE